MHTTLETQQTQSWRHNKPCNEGIPYRVCLNNLWHLFVACISLKATVWSSTLNWFQNSTESTLSVLCCLTLVVHYQGKQQHASQPAFGTSKTTSYALWVSIEPSYTPKWNLGIWVVSIMGSINKDFLMLSCISIYFGNFLWPFLFGFGAMVFKRTPRDM